MDEVKLLLKDLATPEAEVRFDPPSRSTPGSIQTNINPPQATWEWPVQGSTTATWVWRNVYARNAQAVTTGDVGNFGYQSDTNTYYQLTEASPPVWRATPNPTNTSSPFELATGASDAPSYHDFFRLQLAFQDVWEELVDPTIQRLGEDLYAQWNALMDPQLDDTGTLDRQETFASQDKPPDITISSVDELKDFINDLRVTLGITDGSATSAAAGEITQLQDVALKTLTACKMLLQVINWGGSAGWARWQDWPQEKSGISNTDPIGDDLADIDKFYPGVQRVQVFDRIIADLKAPVAGPGPHQDAQAGQPVQDVKLQDLINALTALESILKEKYRFDVFSPASINFGLLLNYRQRWEPQSYQVGNLISSIPLTPQETRRYTTKTVVKRSRSAKEITDSLRSGKDDASTTWRTDAEIVGRAKNQTNFQANASGSYGNDNLYKISAALQQSRDQAVESAQTKHEFHEVVVKASQEYRNEHKTEIVTEESREDESTSYREIRNPNDELTVTYLFYELQRRFLVDEALHKVTPVVLVANEVPGPEQIDQGWILRHDWIIKRAILDDSFLPALEYLSANYTAENVELQGLISRPSLTFTRAR